MMVPKVQGTILDSIIEEFPSTSNVLDPFVGSGTSLVECMHRGLAFTGIDINPLAGLLSLVKAQPSDPIRMKNGFASLLRRIALDDLGITRPPFLHQDKWFEESASVHLSRIVRSIEQEEDLSLRRVFWVGLARCIRLVCNSRQSTYKLHQRPREDIENRNNNAATATFTNALKDVIAQLSAHHSQLSSAGLLNKEGKYVRKVNIVIGPAQSVLINTTDEKFDLIVTSPPYGDNGTTVPYGQYSYLALQWIPLSDICENVNKNLVANTHSTDTASLGGSLSQALERGTKTCGHLPAYQAAIKILGTNQNGAKRFASFSADLAQTAALLAERTKSGGLHVWTVGDRYIGGERVPTGELLSEVLSEHGVQPLHVADRRIIAKKMALRNASSRTMTTERIIVGMKG